MNQQHHWQRSREVQAAMEIHALSREYARLREAGTDPASTPARLLRDGIVAHAQQLAELAESMTAA